LNNDFRFEHEINNEKCYKIYISYIWLYATGAGKKPSVGQKEKHLNHQQPQTNPQQTHHR
jgi:hypothetical protein